MESVDIFELYKVVFTDYPEIVSVAEMQSMLGISRHAAYELVHSGAIPAIKFGTSFRIVKFNILKFVIEEPSGAFKPLIAKDYKKTKKKKDV